MLEHTYCTVMGVEARGVEIQPQYSLDPDSIDSFWENTEM